MTNKPSVIYLTLRILLCLNKHTINSLKAEHKSKSIITMANIATQRIQREFNEVAKSDEVAKNLISIELVNNSLVELKGRIAGPPDTPYEGGIFHLEIRIPETYPFNPPKVRILSALT